MGNSSELAPSVPAPAPYEPNAILRWLYRRFFSHINVDDNWSRSVRDAASKGVVVYVMRSLSFLDFLCLDFLLKRFGLPLVHFVNDLGLWILEPFGKGDRRLSFRRQIPEDAALEKTVSNGSSALLFLRRPPRFGTRARRGRHLDADHIRTLVEVQRNSETSMLLVPQTFVWSLSPSSSQSSILDLLFGPTQWPGRLRVLAQFLLNYRNARLRSGEAFDLKAFVETHAELSDAQMADKVRYALLRKMERERTMVVGPLKKSTARIQDELLRSPRVREHIEAHAASKGISFGRALAVARKELRRLCAKQSQLVIETLSRLLGRVWTRMYDGIVVDKEGLERLRGAARDGAVVLLPSHKSHIDYLVLSTVMYERALLPPLIAAGENLNFWPIGPLLRRGGAFFIKRSFQGQKLYSALVHAYMRKLLVEGYTVEFFLEGGRSRTGKLLPPKYGLLSMVVDSAMMLEGKKVQFVPISIGYERIIEERSFVHELSGGEKQSENVGDLLKSSGVLQSKWGRLYVNFGEIIDFDDVLDEALHRRNGSTKHRSKLTPKERRTMTKRLAQRVMYRINQVTVVTPAALVATALLSHTKRGMTRSALFETCDELLHTLEAEDAPTAHQLRMADGKLRDDTIGEAVRLFLDARLIVKHESGPEPIYTIESERRIALEYYQNTIIHFFVPRAMVSNAVLIDREEIVPLSRLARRIRELSRLFKHEFMFRSESRFDESFNDVIEKMVAAGELERVGDGVRITEGGTRRRVRRYATMIQTFFEAYLLALRSSEIVLDGPISRKEWFKRTLAIGQQMYLAGEIERRETLSKLKLETALKALKDYELVGFAPSDTLERGEGLRTTDDLRALEPKLTPFLR